MLVRRRPSLALAFVLLALCAVAIGGCGEGVAPTAGGGGVRIVAAENFWGSIASQLAGNRGAVQSIITNPAEDPHSYEPTAGDARTLATAQLAIANGIGYDPWMARLLAANPTPGRLSLTVGSVLGLPDGENPHRWYDPADVERIATAITADLRRLDAKDSAYFERRHAVFETQYLREYHRLIAEIRRRYSGVAVGASESIFAPLAPALGLDLITPYSFMNAISEGTEVTAKDTLSAERQLTTHHIKVWIYNAQNVTPEVQRLNALARRAHIPVVTITETLTPATVSFEQWQVAQLQRIAAALRTATGR